MQCSLSGLLLSILYMFIKTGLRKDIQSRARGEGCTVTFVSYSVTYITGILLRCTYVQFNHTPVLKSTTKTYRTEMNNKTRTPGTQHGASAVEGSLSDLPKDGEAGTRAQRCPRTRAGNPTTTPGPAARGSGPASQLCTSARWQHG